MSASPTILLPPDWSEQWKRAHARIDQAGYGDSVSAAYRETGPKLAALVGAELALRLGRAVSDVAIRCDRRTAVILCSSALDAARRLSGSNETGQWLQAVESVVKAAPKAVGALLENTDRLLRGLDLEGFLTFVRMGVAIGRRSPERQLAFFRLADAEARQFLDHTAMPNGFHVFEARLKPYLSAIWGINPPMREAPADAPENMRRRTGFGAGGIRLPPAFTGFTADGALDLYRAALAHVGAHHRYTRQRFPVDSLKPLQLAVVSLIEDARIERLAMRDMPGLGRLWRSFHLARAGRAPVAVTLMARLSRALIDPDYIDPDGWVEKGRALFEAAARDDLTDQSLSRRIGGLLGNDLGQMRLQFDAKAYVVQPAYRDDNLGIWDFGDQAPDVTIMMDEMISGARIERQETDDGKPDERDAHKDPEQRFSRASLAMSDEVATTVVNYHEFDYVVGKDRPKWCTLRELGAASGDIEAVRQFEEKRSDIADRLSSLIRSAKISRAERIRRQPEGEYLDMDACIEASISHRVGEIPDFRVYGRSERRSRDFSVLVLLDVSQSTADRIHGKDDTVLDLERFSTALLAKALSSAGDPFAIAAFCSDTREDVRYFRIKDFDGAYNAFARSRLAGIRSCLSTRLGAAIRHAGADLARCQSHRRLLLVVTDGEPSDVDVDDNRYLVEDARAAVHSLNRNGIDTFCVALDSDARSHADRIFGRRGTAAIASVEQLPVQLPTIFYRLTR